MRTGLAAALIVLTLAACDDGLAPQDRRALALLATRGTTSRLAIADADGGDIRILPGEGRESQPAWSPDGTQLAFVREAEGGLADLGVRDLRTGAVRLLTATPAVAETEPAWSPDGRRITFTRQADAGLSLWEIDVASGATQRIAAEGWSSAWAPDGRLAYIAPDPRGRTTAVWVRPASGAPAVALPDSGYVNRSPGWSRDGRLAWVRVLYCCGSLQYSYLVVSDAMLANARPLVADSAILATPSWSPAGDRLVVTRTRYDDVALLVVDAASGRRRRISGSSREGQPVYANAYARWRPVP